MTREQREAVKAKALDEYRRGDVLALIAARHGVSVATISLWALSAGLERRKQGCRKKTRPSDRDILIVNAVRAVVDGKPTLAEIGKRWNTSRGNVHRIYHKWKNWTPDAPPAPKIGLSVSGSPADLVLASVKPTHPNGCDDLKAPVDREEPHRALRNERNGNEPASVASVTSVADCFPMNVLPQTVRQMVEEVADVATVPMALPACQALAIVSAALGAGLAIPSDRERQTFGNIYLVLAAESGAGKSVTFKQLMAPVYAYQHELQSASQARHYGLKAELLRLKGTLRRVESGKEPVDAEVLPGLIRRKEAIEAELKHMPKIVCEDISREKLQVLLAQNDERMFSASADARQVIQAVLHGKGDNPYLKSWSGDPVDVDRISRDAVPLKAPRMALLWLPQPDLVAEMFAKRILTENGFLPRVLPSVVDCAPALIGNRTRRVSPKTEKDWSDLVCKLFQQYHVKSRDPFLLRPDAKLQRLLITYYNSVVERRRDELADVGRFAARWAEQAWRLTVVLHAASHGANAHAQVVQARTAQNAISLMEFFSEQQLELLRRTRAHRRTEAVEAVFNLLASKAEITVRDMMREHIKDNANDARALLEQLVRDGKLVARDHTPERGGHPTRKYRRCDSCDARQTGARAQNCAQ